MEIEFHNRENEIKAVKNILKTRPDLITFIYGPINSGKTELINHLIKQLPGDYVTFYVNLRGRFIRDYEDFIRVLFKFEKDGREKLLKAIADQSVKLLRFKGIPASEEVLNLIFREKKGGDVFEFLEDYLTSIAEKKKPVLIIDELQVIGDIKLDGMLIYRLFNFFIRLTKELHACHVFAITSDSLFMEKVYSEAMLQGRCRYLLVDDFDYFTTADFLRKYGFSDGEIDLVWNYFGGKPVYLVEAVKTKLNNEDLRELAEMMLKIRVSQIADFIYGLDAFEQVVKLFERIDIRESVLYKKVDDAIRLCVKENILFVDPVERIVKPQSKLDLLAIRKVLEEIRAARDD
jgi:AAA+ ATPase superfamily predicted ATPase